MSVVDTGRCLQKEANHRLERPGCAGRSVAVLDMLKRSSITILSIVAGTLLTAWADQVIE